ncbi:MAG: hypothetical protein RIG63_09000 [Coleofasciculus chthonoplastes F3-SA18-01]|jgi:hypothetical protein
MSQKNETTVLFTFIKNAENWFGATVEFIPTTTQALRALADNPGGIYYASAPEVVPQCTIKLYRLDANPMN